MRIIPFKDFPSFTEEVTLEGIPYTFRFDWNSRGEFWSMDIYDREKNPLILGRRIMLDYEILRQFPDRELPPGELYVIDPSLNFDPIQQNDFIDNRVSLVYLEEDEIASF